MMRLQARFFSEGKLSRYQRSKYRTMQGQIFREWEDHSTKQILFILFYFCTEYSYVWLFYMNEQYFCPVSCCVFY